MVRTVVLVVVVMEMGLPVMAIYLLGLPRRAMMVQMVVGLVAVAVAVIRRLVRLQAMEV
jgi:hypothetical protein